ncbi:MAG: hypothetical protein BRD23_08570 [Halobacteriales archaeon SW_9_67_25]|jgi:hypothetical protein|nr:MAG: hypothetical protein BRD23_08570 [Halobacteriales archaeon SW_9_67_25]
MLRGEVPSAGDATREELLTAYEELLVGTIKRVGFEAVVSGTAIDESTVRALLEGDRPGLTLEEATALLATDPDRPDADTLLAEARNMLLMGMSAAILDVETLAAGVDGAMEPKEIQQKVEGRHQMTVEEYALLHSYIEGVKP